MSKPHELHKQAWKAYEASRYRDAALLWQQAADQSRELQRTADWFTCQVWAAEALKASSEYRQAFSLLLEAHLHEPADRPDYEAWIARKNIIEIGLATDPEYSRLRRYLDELQQLSQTQNTPAGDLPNIEGRIYAQQGNFTAALNAFEQAWQVHDGKGYMKYAHAFNAVSCCLALGKTKAARDWLQAGLQTQEQYQDRLILAARYELKIALAEGKWQTLPNLLSKLDDITAESQDGGDGDNLDQLATRVQLLTDPNQDPLKTNHPAHQSLLRPLFDRQSVHSQFDYRLLMLDFRLAALRFAVGIKPVDDFYYTKPQKIPHWQIKQPLPDTPKRLQRALSSCQLAQQYGKRIDDLLQCDYRQQVVAKRRERIQEIADFIAKK